MNWKCIHSFTSSKDYVFDEDEVISNEEYELLMIDELDNFSSTDEPVTKKKKK